MELLAVKPVTVYFAPEKFMNQITVNFYECLVDLKVRDWLQLIVWGHIDWVNALFRFNFHRRTKRFWMHLARIPVARDAGFHLQLLNSLWESVLIVFEGLAKSLFCNFWHGYHNGIPHVKTSYSTYILWVGDIIDLWLDISHWNYVPHSRNINVIAKSVIFLYISFNGDRNMVSSKVMLLAITYTHSLDANWTLI